MDVAELVPIGPDAAAEAALVELRVVHIVEHLEPGGANEPGHLRRHPGGSQEVAHMVLDDIQRLQVHQNAALLRNPRTLPQGVEHGAELHRAAEPVIGIDDGAALPQAIGVDGERPRPHPLRRLHRAAEEVQIRLLLAWIDQRQLRVPIEAGDAHPGPLRRRLHSVQVLVRPAPEFHKREAVVLRRLEALQKGELAVHRLNTG